MWYIPQLSPWEEFIYMCFWNEIDTTFYKTVSLTVAVVTIILATQETEAGRSNIQRQHKHPPAPHTHTLTHNMPSFSLYISIFRLNRSGGMESTLNHFFLHGYKNSLKIISLPDRYPLLEHNKSLCSKNGSTPMIMGS